MTRWIPRRRLLGMSLCVWLGLSAAGCDRKATPSAPDVILIVADTLRADHLGCYGYERATSPNIDAFARGAALYERSLSTAPWTLPSHASMFTGLYPCQHGAFTVRTPRKTARDAHPLAAKHEMLAEVLGAAGYQTAAFVANVHFLEPWTGIDQGFDHYEMPEGIVGADEINRRVLRWLDNERDASRPLFLFINYFDTHRPYNSKPRPGFLEPEGHPGMLLTEFARRVLPQVEPAPADLRQLLIDHYDTAIANLDEQIGNLLEALERRGRSDDSLIMLTSDHGEYFGEHDLVEHSRDLYQPAVAVPLIVKAPRQTSGRVVSRVVDSTIIPRLVVEHLPPRLSAGFPEAFTPGDGGRARVENYYSRSKDLFNEAWRHRFLRVRVAAYDWPFKYIESSDGAHELYDLASDPAESHNLVVERADVGARLAAWLAAFPCEYVEGRPPPKDEEPSAEQIKRLRAIGYLGEGGEDESP